MPVHVGVFLITFSGLVFEIGLTRIYSATIWYHFAFVAVSVALLGWGLGGFALHLLKGRWVTPTLDKAAALAIVYGLTIPACLGLVVRFPFTLERLPLYFVAPLVPFFIAGIALSMVFDLRRDRSSSLYFADLLGASLGALVVTWLLQGLGGETAVLVAALAPFVAAACLSTRTPIRGLAGAAAVLVVGLAVTNETSGLLRVTPGTLKAMRRQMDELPSARVAQTGWNAYSRIDAVEGFRIAVPGAAVHRLRRLDEHPRVGRQPRERARHADLVSRAAVQAHARTPTRSSSARAAASDVLVALASGSRKVTAVELNPLMLRFVRHYGARAGNLYDRPDVEVIQSEGRNFISRTDSRFDVIFLGFVDSWASVASGGLSLSENYLYTTEAFNGYYDHLTDDGVLVHPALGRGHPAAGLERGGAPRRRRSRQADRRAGREARGRSRRSAADDLHAAEASVHRGGNGADHERVDDGASRCIVPGRHADRAVRGSAVRPQDDGAVRSRGAAPGGSGLRRQPVLLRDRAAARHAVTHDRRALGPRRARVRSAGGCSCCSASRSGQPVGALCGVGRLLRLSGPGLHHRRARVAAEPDAAARPSDLHAVDAAVHAAGGRRRRQRAEPPRLGVRPHVSSSRCSASSARSRCL